VFAVRLVLAHDKGNKKNLTLTVGQGGNGRRWGKKFTVRQCKKRTAKFVFAVRQCKNALQTFFWPCVFFRRASLEKRTAKHLFAVRPKKYARQTFRRTANMEFPVVTRPYIISSVN
jgi:hypothetical protein